MNFTVQSYIVFHYYKHRVEQNYWYQTVGSCCLIWTKQSCLHILLKLTCNLSCCFPLHNAAIKQKSNNIQNNKTVMMIKLFFSPVILVSLSCYKELHGPFPSILQVIQMQNFSFKIMDTVKWNFFFKLCCRTTDKSVVLQPLPSTLWRWVRLWFTRQTRAIMNYTWNIYEWDHKPLRKMFTDVINQVASYSHRHYTVLSARCRRYGRL